MLSYLTQIIKYDLISPQLLQQHAMLAVHSFLSSPGTTFFFQFPSHHIPSTKPPVLPVPSSPTSNSSQQLLRGGLVGSAEGPARWAFLVAQYSCSSHWADFLGCTAAWSSALSSSLFLDQCVCWERFASQEQMQTTRVVSLPHLSSSL